MSSLPLNSSDIHLIVVDCQHDFCHPEGALYVPQGECAVENIASLLKSGKVARVTFTLDWHPLDHCSFQPQGGHGPCTACSIAAAQLWQKV